MSKKIHTLILKSVSHCNLACKYCSAHCESNKHNQKYIDPVNVINLFTLLLKNNNIPKQIKLLWHGGEPTLYFPDKAKYLMDNLSMIASENNTEILFIMQTNGYHISKEWLNLIKIFNIGIGLSLDGPAEIHNQKRITQTNIGSYDSIINTIKLLKDNNIKVSLLSVIDERHINKEQLFCQWLSDIKLSVKLNPCFDINTKNINSFNYYFEFLEKFYRHMIESDNDLSIEPISHMLQSILYKTKPTECNYSGECGQHILCLDYNNMLSACGRISDNNDNDSFVFENNINILNFALNTITQKMSNSIIQRKQIVNCQNCPHLFMCNAGCSAYLNTENIKDYCQCFKNFMEFMNNEALILLKKRLMKEKNYLKQKIKNFHENN